jgi:predicted aconitase with swiveling domain
MRLKGRVIARGTASGEILLSSEPISFLGGVDAKSGEVVEKGHPLFGKSIAGKVLVFPRGKGSTVGTYTIYQLKKNGVAPAAIINGEAEIIVAVGAIISGIPMLDKLEGYERLKSGMKVKMDAEKGFVEW